MRSSVNTAGLYAACLPDNSAVSSIYNCPAVDDSLFDSNSELKRIAGDQLHVASAPIVDMLGDKLAGTLEDPVYLDLDGRNCSHPNPSQSCPLKSTGFFLRSNPASDSTPGSIRFVVKLEQNRNAPATKGASPLRTQYLSIDVGSEWQQSEAFCPQGSIKLGYLGNGQPNCVNPTAKKCDAGTIYLGVDNSANPICKTPPTTCASGGVIIDTASNDLVCSSATPCSGQGEIFMGYYSGTGNAICSKLDVSCPDGQVQVGIENGLTGAPTAVCKQLPSCQDSQKLSYDGSQFVCQSASVASTCADGEVVVGINTDGSAQCQAAQRGLASTNLSCPDGQYVSGLQSDGAVICRNLVSTSSTNSVSTTNWEEIPLADTGDVNPECEYRAKVRVNTQAAINFMNAAISWRQSIAVSNKFIGLSYVNDSSGAGVIQGIPVENKRLIGMRGATGGFVPYGSGAEILALQKRCSINAVQAAPSAVGATCGSDGMGLVMYESTEYGLSRKARCCYISNGGAVSGGYHDGVVRHIRCDAL
ncbi:MAG: hypothetical protein R3A80_09170 [Bdellovibrionota bacterium]